MSGRRVVPAAICASAAAAVIAGTQVLAGPEVSAAPNPFGAESAAHTVTLAADGTYAVETEQNVELVRAYEIDFGETIHDGFRLPDTDSVLPPYLRADYGRATVSVDGDDAEAVGTRRGHAVAMFSSGTFAEGEHTAVFGYRVSGAAVPAEMVDAGAQGSVVYIRPLMPGGMTITSEESIVAVDCEILPPQADPCGDGDDDRWTIDEDEIGEHGVVRVHLETDPSGMADPVIDIGAAEAG